MSGQQPVTSVEPLVGETGRTIAKGPGARLGILIGAPLGVFVIFVFVRFGFGEGSVPFLNLLGSLMLAAGAVLQAVQYDRSLHNDPTHSRVRPFGDWGWALVAMGAAVVAGNAGGEIAAAFFAPEMATEN